MKRFFSVLFIAAALITMGSCNKQKDTIAIVRVVEQADGTTPVVGATVRLVTDFTGTEFEREGIEKEGTTNGAGEAFFNYNDLFKRGQAGMFVLTVEVEKGFSTADGIIKVVEEESSEAIIEIDVP